MLRYLFVATIAALTAQSPAGDLLDAARHGGLRKLADSIADGADIDTRDELGRTPLMLAVVRGDQVMVSALLNVGADPHLEDHDGATALVLAERHGSAIRDILVEAGAVVVRKNEDEPSPVVPDAIEEKGTQAAQPEDTAEQGQNLERQLHQAIVDGNHEAVSRFIAQGADVNAPETDDYRPPLMMAVEHRQLEILSRLLAAGADPTQEATGIFTWGDNAITLAAKRESPWALDVLVQAGARKEDLDRAMLAGCTHLSVLRVLFQAGADANARGDKGQTPLMCAAAAGANEAVSALVDAGARIDDTSDDGRTAGEWAAESGHDAVVTLLHRAATRQ